MVARVTLVAAVFELCAAMGDRENKLVWGDGEELSDFLRRMDAYLLSVGDEKKAVGKALLGLGSKIGVMDSFSEEDTKNIKNLKLALQREFGRTPRWYGDAFRDRSKLTSETYGMYLAALRSLFLGAFPGTDPESPVGEALLKTRFLDGISSPIAGQLRLLFPDVALTALPEHARRVEEAVSSSTPAARPAVQQVGEGRRREETAEQDPVAQLRAEVAELTRSVQAIRAGVTSPVAGAEAAADRSGVTSSRPRSVGGAQRADWGSGGGAQGRGQQGGWGPRDFAGRPGVVRGGGWRPVGGQGLRCWTCGETGHMQRECLRSPVGRGRGKPAQVVCWRCQEFGHTQYDCPFNLN